MYYFASFFVLVSLMGCSGNSFSREKSQDSISSSSKTSLLRKSYDMDKIYEGFSFDFSINGEKVAYSKAISKRKLLKNYSGSSSSVIWGLKHSIQSPMIFNVKAIDNLSSYIGYMKPNSYEVMVFPLQKVHLNFRKVEDEREDIRINGRPLLTHIKLLDKIDLPSGEYVFAVRVKGSENWDRKEVYVKVENKEKEMEERGIAAPLSGYTLPIGKYKDRVALVTHRPEEEKRAYSKALLYQNQLTTYDEASDKNENFTRSSHYNKEAIKYEKLGEYEKALEYKKKIILDLNLMS